LLSVELSHTCGSKSGALVAVLDLGEETGGALRVRRADRA
jgi:hypothetical protein